MDAILNRQRQIVIRERLGSEGRVVAAALAAEFGVSEDTIRRDLREMAAAGLCERVYGGALPLAPRAGPLGMRRGVDAPAKAALARAAAAFIEPNTAVFIDAGSTNVAIAEALPKVENLTVITNAPAVAQGVLSNRGPEVVLLGGRFDAALGACLGAKTVSDALHLRPDLLVLGACGVDHEAGLTAFSHEEAELKRCLAARSRRILVAATGDKIGTAAPFAVLPTGGIHQLVVAHDCARETVDAFEAAGVRVARAGEPSG